MQAAAVESAGRRLVMLLVLSGGALLSTATTVGISPFLLNIAHDLGTDLAAASNLVAMQSVAWGVASFFAGMASDRLGRRPILAAGLLTLAVSEIGGAYADNYPLEAVWRIVGGFGGGSYMGTVFATVSDHFPAAERGRSLGWVVTGQSLALVLGVPAMTLAGAVAGWRGAVLGHAVALAVGMTCVWLSVPSRSRHVSQVPIPMAKLRRLIGPRVLALLGATTSERVCYAAVAVFLPTYLLTRYTIDSPALAGGLALVAAGNLAGNVLGGQLSDRVRVPQVVAMISLLASAALAVPVLTWAPAVEVSVALGFVYTLVNAAGRPALLSVLSSVSAEARGAVLGLNISFSSLGWLAATALGGFVVAVGGFGSLGLLTCAFGILGAALTLINWLLPRMSFASSQPTIAPQER